jgi:DNA-directed RNA polymerase subunit omega
LKPNPWQSGSSREYGSPRLDHSCKGLYIDVIMVLPLDLLTGFQGNVYELTCAAMKRGVQINLAGDDELDQNKGKIVSTALKQILTGKVKYQHEA